jgi:hypothetical protein
LTKNPPNGGFFFAPVSRPGARGSNPVSPILIDQVIHQKAPVEDIAAWLESCMEHIR